VRASRAGQSSGGPVDPRSPSPTPCPSSVRAAGSALMCFSIPRRPPCSWDAGAEGARRASSRAVEGVEEAKSETLVGVLRHLGGRIHEESRSEERRVGKEGKC